jgi:hypothetical protein
MRLAFVARSPSGSRTHRVMSPLEFMHRLAAWVPRPRLHLIRSHGVLAPKAKLRAAQVGAAELGPAACASRPFAGYFLRPQAGVMSTAKYRCANLA